MKYNNQVNNSVAKTECYRHKALIFSLTVLMLFVVSRPCACLELSSYVVEQSNPIRSRQWDSWNLISPKCNYKRNKQWLDRRLYYYITDYKYIDYRRLSFAQHNLNTEQLCWIKAPFFY